jgi:hypothetical protein
MARILVTGPELAALFPRDVGDHVMAAFAAYRLSDEWLRAIGEGALAARASRSSDAAASIAALTARIREALEASAEVVRVQARDGEEAWTTVVLGWGAVQVTTNNAGWFLAEDFEPSDVHTPTGLAKAVPDRPALLVDRFTASGCKVLGHQKGWTATYDTADKVWRQVAREGPSDFLDRLALWLGASAA